jgi:hypothetical protein
MLFTDDAERTLAEAVGQLVYGNPFLGERIEAERLGLGKAFDPAGTLWDVPEEPASAPNLVQLHVRGTMLADACRERLAAGAAASPEALRLYEALVMYLAYDRCQAALYELVLDPKAATRPVACSEPFRQDLEHYLGVRPAAFWAIREPAHFFACCYQVRRAFHAIYAYILGTSAPARRLRAAVWQSIFTAHPQRYRESVYARMGDIATLIVGPTGTGKELVARAIGLSRYIPFDPRKRAFTEDPSTAFFPLNLAALSPTLIESELFGHRKGAFTGRSPTAKDGSKSAQLAGRSSSTRSGRWSRPSR